MERFRENIRDTPGFLELTGQHSRPSSPEPIDDKTGGNDGQHFTSGQKQVQEEHSRPPSPAPIDDKTGGNGRQ